MDIREIQAHTILHKGSTLVGMCYLSQIQHGAHLMHLLCNDTTHVLMRNQAIGGMLAIKILKKIVLWDEY